MRLSQATSSALFPIVLDGAVAQARDQGCGDVGVLTSPSTRSLASSGDCGLLDIAVSGDPLHFAVCRATQKLSAPQVRLDHTAETWSRRSRGLQAVADLDLHNMSPKL